MIRGLLAFARRQPLRPSRIEINERVSNMNSLLSRVVGEDIEILVELAPNLWPVIADPSQVEASIVNLATNARDAMPRGGRLTIATGNQHLDAAYATLNPAAAPGDYAMITVSDTGTGMTPEVMANVFEPFFTTKEQGKGTGLGLSMVFGFANQSGGHVSIYSEPGLVRQSASSCLGRRISRRRMPRCVHSARSVLRRAMVKRCWWSRTTPLCARRW